MPSASLLLVCHAATAATRKAAFPVHDEPLDRTGAEAAARAARHVRRVDAAWTAPERRARQTAAALGLDAGEAPALRDLDCGRWSGRGLDEVAAAEPAGVCAWSSGADQAPHGGETVSALLDRVRLWLSDVAPRSERLVAVTHAAVMRAAVVATLDAAPASFWRIDIAPLCRVRLRSSSGRWTLLSIEPAAGRPD